MKQRRTFFHLALIALLSCSLLEAQKIIVQYKPDVSRFSSTKRAHYRTYHIKIEFSGGKAVEDIKLDPPSATSLTGRNSKTIHNLGALGPVTSMKIEEMGTELMQDVKPEIITAINNLMGKDKPDIVLDATAKVKKTSSKFSFKDEHRHKVHFKVEVFPENYKGPRWDKKEKGKEAEGTYCNDKGFCAARWTVDLRKKLK